jgi:hypothetical protein
MDYASGKPLPSNQESSSKRQSTWEEEDGTNKNSYHKDFQMQRKNSMTSSIRKSYSRSHSGDMSNLIKNKIDSPTNNQYSASNEENTTTMPIKRKLDNKKYSDQSLNSHNSDEYYEEEELGEVSDKEFNNNTSEEEDDYFLNTSIIDTDGNDTIDGHIVNLKKVTSNRFFSRLVEATSSFSNSTPSLPSMVKRSTYLNNSRNQNLRSIHRRSNEVKLESAKFYPIDDEDTYIEQEDKNKDISDLKNNNEGVNFCECGNEEDGSLDL